MSIGDQKVGDIFLTDNFSKPEENVTYIEIDDYVFETLGVKRECLDDPEQYFKNFIHLMCHISRDIKEIEGRLREYRAYYGGKESIKSNEAEFERRKIKYFYELNESALDEINQFVATEMTGFLKDFRYDTLKRECERDGLSDLFYRRRYNCSWHHDYYSMDYPFGVIVKAEQYVKEKFSLEQKIEKEQQLIDSYRSNPNQLWKMMRIYVIMIK